MACCPDGAVHIYSNSAGKVVALHTDEGTPMAFTIDGDDDTLHDLKAICTSVGIQGQSGFQFMHAMREFVYVYVFTERVGEIVVNGVTFPASCSILGPQDGAQAGCVIGVSGLERVIRYYECNRITSRAVPIILSFGPYVHYEGFLTSMKADIVDPSLGIAQFSYRFNYIPNVTSDDILCFDLSESCLEDPCPE